MHLLAIHILNYQPERNPLLLVATEEVSRFSFFQRSTVRELLREFSRIIIKRTGLGQRQSIEHEQYMVHTYLRHNGLGVSVITDAEYPSRVAHLLVQKTIDEFEIQHPNWMTMEYDNTTMDEEILKYQNPQEVDRISKIKRNIEETKDILHKSIETILENGTRLDELVERSNDLNAHSKLFYRNARRANSCCVIS